MQNQFELCVDANKRAFQANSEAVLAAVYLTCSVYSGVASMLFDLFFPRRRIEQTVTSSHFGSHMVIEPKIARWAPRG